ncbi:MAG: nuclear transport factor 2 family protein [Candidatus Riflebacteria bacterium]|nr:nuclear transport factor 2 family protein [Candidatus Riflebacteria bacterium]
MTDVEMVFAKYMQTLSDQKPDAATSFFHENATVFFREGSYFGKNQISQILKNTFSIIKDETFTPSKVNWHYKSNDTAACTFQYEWSGRIQGKRFTTLGRGSLTWVKDINGDWKIITEHFGPTPK